MQQVGFSDNKDWIKLMHELSLQRMDSEIKRLKEQNYNLKVLLQREKDRVRKAIARGVGR